MPVQEMTETQSITQMQPVSGSRDLPSLRSRRPNGNTYDSAARFLGWFSIGLGIAEVFFPRKLARAIGAPQRPMATRLMGLREAGVGVGILASDRPARWMKARVAGDMVDLALLKSAFASARARRGRLAGTTAAVAAITAADVVCAQGLEAIDGRPNRVRVETSLSVNRPAGDCYRFWRQIENFPQFMKNVDQVRITGEKTSRWKLKPIATKALHTKALEWDAEITKDAPGEEIEWRSLPGADVENFGSVRFEPRLSGSGTIVRVAMEYAPLKAARAAGGSRILQMISEHSVREDLRRFKSMIECGEAPTTKGQPAGAGRGGLK